MAQFVFVSVSCHPCLGHPRLEPELAGKCDLRSFGLIGRVSFGGGAEPHS